jgi:hypothetical protein
VDRGIATAAQSPPPQHSMDGFRPTTLARRFPRSRWSGQPKQTGDDHAPADRESATQAESRCHETHPAKRSRGRRHAMKGQNSGRLRLRPFGTQITSDKICRYDGLLPLRTWPPSKPKDPRLVSHRPLKYRYGLLVAPVAIHLVVQRSDADT